MATLAIAKEFLAEFADLQKPVRKNVQELVTKFANDSTAPSINLEPINDSRDPRARTVKIDNYWRGVVAAPESGDTYILVTVLQHDKAIDWCKRRRFTVNQLTGALEVYDVQELEERVAASADPEADNDVLASISDKDLHALGVPDDVVPLLRRLRTEEELLALTTFMPTAVGDVLAMLASGYTVEQAYAEMLEGEVHEPVDTGDLAEAVQRASSGSMFYVVKDEEDLAALLNQPLAFWRVFLHPSQRKYAYRPSYNGPARITGGAGTGKTVALLHRVKHLVERSEEREPILVTTYTKNLARDLESQLRDLVPARLTDSVDVLHVDSLAYRLVNDAESGRRPRVFDGGEADELWTSVVDELGTPFPASFVRQEWEQVVLVRGVVSRDEYFVAPRPGRGVRLDRRARAEIWKAIEEFGNRLAHQGARTHLQLADDAAGYVQRGAARPYRHVLVDEAQDLHPAQWRLLRACVEPGPDDLFIAGDSHQRIYDHRVSLRQLGIDVRGRSYRLRLNYRTTHEIMRYAMQLLGGFTADDLDEGVDTLAGYRSAFHGPMPSVQGYPSKRAELDGLVAAVQTWLAEGVEPQEIGIAARTNSGAEQAVQALHRANLHAILVDADGSAAGIGGIEVATMHRLKGLEYRSVALVDVGISSVPLAVSVTDVESDPVQHELDLQRERCLLYVACTRARDALRISWSGRPSPFLPNEQDG